jgi:nucleoside 2-deoxyribosyltransferase
VRIYLACTVRGDRGGVEAGRLINERLQLHGHQVLTTHLLDDDVDRAESALSEREIFDRDMRWLASCDVLVAEASGSSYGVGFEVGYVLGLARHSDQRVVLLYDAARASVISRLIVGTHDGKCATKAYTSLDDLAAFIDHTFSRAPDAADAKIPRPS